MPIRLDVGALPVTPLSLNTGLAFGLGDRINTSILDENNAGFARALAGLDPADLTGRFWTM